MNDLSDESIRQLLVKKRLFDAERKVLQNLQRSGTKLMDKQKKRLLLLEQYDVYVNGWLDSLPEDEAYAIQRHLIDGIDWPRIATEYNIKWAKENAKTDRTLMNYQKKALKGIADSFCNFPFESFYEMTQR